MSNALLPFSEACERNKAPILGILRSAFSSSRNVLEIGSGTGQHAVYFAQHLPHLAWQPSDRAEHHDALTRRVTAANLTNLRSPLLLDVSQGPWPNVSVDCIFSANCLHIMSWENVRRLFEGVGQMLPRSGGVLAIYGPFRYAGEYTAASNADFDQQLRNRDPLSGIRDIEAVIDMAQEQGLRLVEDHAMPANNQLLRWAR